MWKPDRHITIREMGGFIGTACMKAATPANIRSDFRSTRIVPFDGYVYSDGDLT